MVITNDPEITQRARLLKDLAFPPENMLKINFRAEFFKEGDVYVGLCPELNISSYGDSILEARQALTEAVEAFLEECERMGTLAMSIENFS